MRYQIRAYDITKDDLGEITHFRDFEDAVKYATGYYAHHGHLHQIEIHVDEMGDGHPRRLPFYFYLDASRRKVRARLLATPVDRPYRLSDLWKIETHE